MKPCVQCGAHRPSASAKFCTSCGTKFTNDDNISLPNISTSKTCIHCGQRNVSGKFCNNCGKPLENPAVKSNTNQISNGNLPSTKSIPKTCKSCGSIYSSKYCETCGNVNDSVPSASTPTKDPTTSSTPGILVSEILDNSGRHNKPDKKPDTPTKLSEATKQASVSVGKIDTGSIRGVKSDIPKSVNASVDKVVTKSVKFNTPDTPVNKTAPSPSPSDSNRRCLACSSPNPPDKKFCIKCGEIILEPKSQNPSADSKALEFTQVKLKKPPMISSTSLLINNEPAPVPSTDKKKPPPPKQCEQCRAPITGKICTRCGHHSIILQASIFHTTTKPYVPSRPPNPFMDSGKSSKPAAASVSQASPAPDEEPSKEDERRGWKQRYDTIKKKRTSLESAILPEHVREAASKTEEEQPKQPEKDTRSLLRQKFDSLRGSRSKTAPPQVEEEVRPSPVVGEGEVRGWKQKYDSLRLSTTSAAALKDANDKAEFASSERYEPPTALVKQQTIKRKPKMYTDPNLDPQTKVLLELVETEDDYVNDLYVVINSYMKLIEAEKLLNKEEMATVFSNIVFIYNVNKELNDLFKQSQDIIGVAEALLQKLGALRIYATYCTNHNHAHNTVKKLIGERSDFDTFLQVAQLRPESMSLDLLSFLIKPVQRICKYPLLLKELIKVTPQDTQEYQKLNEAYKRVDDLLTYVNDKKRDAESFHKLKDIAKNKLVGAENYKLILPQRRYVSEGEINVYTNSKLKPAYYFLLNDLFLLTRKKGSKYKPAFEIGHPGLPMPIAVSCETEDQAKLMSEIQEVLEKAVEEYQRIAAALKKMSQKRKKLPPPPSNDDNVIFDCEYLDKRTVKVPKHSLTFEHLVQHICSVFEVEKITIIYDNYYIESPDEFEYLLAEKKTRYELALYDPFDESQNNEV